MTTSFPPQDFEKTKMICRELAGQGLPESRVVCPMVEANLLVVSSMQFHNAHIPSRSGYRQLIASSSILLEFWKAPAVLTPDQLIYRSFIRAATSQKP
eukprot:1136333-Pelagomonas_calceolata.AAC.7